MSTCQTLQRIRTFIEHLLTQWMMFSRSEHQNYIRRCSLCQARSECRRSGNSEIKGAFLRNR